MVGADGVERQDAARRLRSRDDTPADGGEDLVVALSGPACALTHDFIFSLAAMTAICVLIEAGTCISMTIAAVSVISSTAMWRS